MTTVEEPKIVDAKVVLLGALGVGKTSIITRYSQKKFLGTTSPTIGASFTTLRVNVSDTRVRIQLWDTAGQERFRAMAPLYYRNANAAIVAYDVTSSSSYEAMKQWVMELRRNVEEAIVLVLVGNKCDLTRHRVVDKAAAQKYARDIGGHFFECSALSNEGISDMFRNLALQIVEAEERAAASKPFYQAEPSCLPTDPSLGGSLDKFTLSKTLRIEQLPSDSDVLKPQSHCLC
uniref:Putative rab subfamily protein of small gtpase n=1 Tax=Amblyomma aureolatum TaxID=187763 RepID=A0A1E1X4G3_9ACAR